MLNLLWLLFNNLPFVNTVYTYTFAENILMPAKKYARKGVIKIINLESDVIEAITEKALRKKPRSNFKNYVEDLVIKDSKKK